MSRKGSTFAGLSVAMITPFRDGQVDYPLLREQVEFQIAAGTTLPVPGGNRRANRRRLSHPEHERRDRRGGAGCRGTDQGHGGHRLQQHRRGPAA